MEKFNKKMIITIFMFMNCVTAYAAIEGQWTTVNVIISIYGALLLALAISTWHKVEIIGVIKLTKEKEGVDD